MPDKTVTDRAASRTRSRIMASPVLLALWVGLGISLLGDQVYRVSLTWTVTEQIGNVSDGIWLGLAMALPTAVLGILGGVLVDRIDKIRLLITSDLIRAVVVGVMAVALAGLFSSLAAVVGGAFLLATAGVCFTPALQASLPEIVGNDRDRLVALDALILSTMSVVGVFGPTLASVLLPVVGSDWLLAFDAVSFLCSASAILFVRSRRTARTGAPEPAVPKGNRSLRGVLVAAKEGLRFILGHPVLRPQFGVFPFMESASYSILFLLPAYVSHEFGSTSWLFGVLLAGYAAGRVAGSWLISHSRLKSRRGWVLAANFLCQGIAVGAFVASPNWWLALGCYAVAGIPGGASQVALSSYLQTEIPVEMRGRCFAAITSFVTWLMPLGPVIFGAFAAWQGVRASLTLIAAIFLVGGAFICSHRSVRKVL